MAVVGIAGQRLGVEDELAGRRTAVGGHDETLTPIYGPRPLCKSEASRRVKAVCANLFGFDLRLQPRANMESAHFCPQ